MPKPGVFTWKKKPIPGRILAELNKVRSQKRGRVTYDAFVFQDMATTLLSFLVIPKEVGDEEAWDFLRKALSGPTADGKMSLDGILKAVNRTADGYYRRRLTVFYVVTSLSYRGEPPKQWTVANSCRIYFQCKTEKFYKSGELGRGHLSNRLRQLGVPEQKKVYKTTVVRVEGRSNKEAFEKGMRALDEIRGVINFAMNQKHVLRISLGGRQPVNAVRLGPIHTIHQENGDLIPGLFWYEPDFVEPTQLPDLGKQRADLRQAMDHIQNSLAKSELADAAREGLRRYGTALDRPDWALSFRQLWMTLEFLTNTLKLSYNVTIKRIASMYKDYDLALEIADHLRDRRNKLVHIRQDDPQAETLMFQAKRFVETLLWLYIHDPFKLKSRDEVSHFLDLPKDLTELRRRRKLIDAAEKFCS